MKKAELKNNALEVETFKDKLKKIHSYDAERISILQLLEILGSTSFLVLIMIFVAPSSIPLPAIPLVTQVFAMIVFILFLQLIFSAKSVWLPQRIMRKELKANFLKSIASKIIFFHEKYEKFIKKRLVFLFSGALIKLLYLFCLVLSVSVALPIPFSNTIPSIAILIICFSILEKDGVLAFLGIVVGVIGLSIVVLIWFFGVKYLASFF